MGGLWDARYMDNAYIVGLFVLAHILMCFFEVNTDGCKTNLLLNCLRFYDFLLNLKHKTAITRRP